MRMCVYMFKGVHVTHVSQEIGMVTSVLHLPPLFWLWHRGIVASWHRGKLKELKKASLFKGCQK